MATDRSLEAIQHRLATFRDVRGWGRFHTLKDLAAALAIEAAELQELFLWQSVDDEPALLEQRRGAVEDELADVLILALNFAAASDIDVLRALDAKIDKNEAKYPEGASEPKRWS
jgi:NTP pyrophosphatase (non-canonical NTP hydrolase)